MSNTFNPPARMADLPVFGHADELTRAVRENRVVLVTGETGSGKTTGLALLLDHAGYGPVVITQPRITAATSVAEYVALAKGEQVGQSVGYMSSLVRATSPATRVTFITDGLQLAHEVHGQGMPDREDAVLVLDELHERNSNMDTLLALLMERLKKGAKFRLVVCTATMDVPKLKSYLEPVVGNVPHVHIEGRTFAVASHTIKPHEGLEAAKRHLRQGQNVLVLQPGVRQILQWCDDLTGKSLGAEVLPLYADLSKGERDRVFAKYDRPKAIVATSIAQTSITISDLDVVVDSGLVRIPTIDQQGVPGLKTTLASQATCRQRMGRVGRTKPGTAYLVGPDIDRRHDFEAPEIRTSSLEGLVLRLAVAGLRPEDLTWIDKPNANLVALARKRLNLLGALKGDRKVTKIGEEMAAMPLDAPYARMVCEARRRDVVADVLVMVAVAAVGKGIYDSEDPRFDSLFMAYESDYVAEKDLFVDTYRDLMLENPKNADRWLEQHGIIPRRFYRALDLYEALCNNEDIVPFEGLKATHKTKDMIAAIVSGMWPYGIWQSHGRHGVDPHGGKRLLPKTGVTAYDGALVIGEPFNLEENDNLLLLLQRITVVDDKTLRKVVEGGLDTIRKEMPKINRDEQRKRNRKEAVAQSKRHPANRPGGFKGSNKRRRR